MEETIALGAICDFHKDGRFENHGLWKAVVNPVVFCLYSKPQSVQ